MSALEFLNYHGLLFCLPTGYARIKADPPTLPSPIARHTGKKCPALIRIVGDRSVPLSSPCLNGRAVSDPLFINRKGYRHEVVFDCR